MALNSKLTLIIAASVGAAAVIGGATYWYVMHQNGVDLRENADIEWKYDFEEGPPEPLFNLDDSEDCAAKIEEMYGTAKGIWTSAYED